MPPSAGEGGGAVARTRAPRHAPPAPKRKAANGDHVLGAPLRGAIEVEQASSSRGRRSTCVRAFCTYPLKLIVPSLPSSQADCVWIYALTYGGGLVAGDEVGLLVDVARGSSAVLATQATTKVFKSERARASLMVPQAVAVGDAGVADTPPPAVGDTAAAAAGIGGGRKERTPPSAGPSKASVIVRRRPTSAAQSLHAKLGSGALLVVVPDPVSAFLDSKYVQRQRFSLGPDSSLVLVDWLTSGRAAMSGGSGPEHWSFQSFESTNIVSLRTPRKENEEEEEEEEEEGEEEEEDEEEGEIEVIKETVRLQQPGQQPAGTPPLHSTVAERMGVIKCVANVFLLGPRTATLRRHAPTFLTPLVQATLKGGAAYVLPTAESPTASPAAAAADTVSPTGDANPPLVSMGPIGQSSDFGVVVRIAAESTEAVYSVLRGLLAPLKEDLGSAPYNERGLA